MPLSESYKKQGAFLFRWRSYLPLLAIPVVLAALCSHEYTHRLFGERFDNFWEGFCILISFSGIFVRSMVAGYVPRGTSGRNTQTQVAETLNRTGIYSTVRNPLYLGNYLIVLGILLFTQVWWLVLIGTIAFWRYYERIIYTEEEFLREKFGETFVSWAEKTPMVIPDFRKWVKPSLPFSRKTVLRREHSTLFGVIVAFSILGVLADFFVEKEGRIDVFWIAFFVSGLVIYMILRYFKKKTRLLDSEGR